MKREKLSENELDLITGGTLYVQSSTNGKKYEVTGIYTNADTGEFMLKYDNNNEVGYAATGIVKNSSLGAIFAKLKWDISDLSSIINHTVTVDEDLI